MRVLVSSVMLSGCVEATAYEQATSAAAVHQEGRRRLSGELEHKEAELARLARQNERLKAENARLEQALVDQKGAFDQAELDLVLAKQEKNEEASLVQQLRGDLARVGSHLDTFADEKADLDAALAAARTENEVLSARMASMESAQQETESAHPDAETPAPSPAAPVQAPQGESMPPGDEVPE